MRLTNSKDLAIKLEKTLLEKFNEKTRTNLKMIVFGFNPYDYTSINIWFLNEWEDFLYINENEREATITDDSFSKIADCINGINELPLFENSIRLQHFYNRLRFSNKLQDKYYNSLENHRRFSLIDAVQTLCQRQNLSEFDNLIGFWVTNLHSVEHPELVSLYSPKGDKELLPIKLERDGIENDDAACWCKLEDNGIHLFCPDPDCLDDFKEIIRKDSTTYFINYREVKYFGIKKDGEIRSVHVLTSDNQKFQINKNTTGANGVLVPSAYIENNIYRHFRQHCSGKEVTVGDMPNPHDNEIFMAWVQGQRELSINFGWRDLNNAIEKHGIIAALKFLPSIQPNDYLYKVLHKTAIDPLIRAQCYQEAYHSYKCLSEEQQVALWRSHIVILIGLKKHQALEKTMADIRAGKNFYEWMEFHLREIESLLLWRKSEVQKAISVLESIPKEKRGSDYIWYEACFYSEVKPSYALQQFKLAMNYPKPSLPVAEDYRFHKEITGIQKQKQEAINHAKGISKQIEQERVLANPNVIKLNMWQTLKKSLREKNSEKWQEIATVKPQTGSPKYLFKYQGRIYHLSSSGELSQVNYHNEVMILENASIVSKNVECAFQYGKLLFVAAEGQGILTINLTTAKILHQQSRYFTERISGMFVDKNYLILCTVAGVEFYVKEQGYQWRFVNLLGVGTDRLAYSWAKDAIIVDDNLYVAAGNAGLLIFTLNNQKIPVYHTRLVFNAKQPFVDKIQCVNNRLLLNPNKGIWVVSIEDRKNPVSLTFFRGTQKSELCLPIIIESDDWLVFDNGQPTVWEIDGNTLKQNNKQKVIQGSDSSMSIYHCFHNAIPFAKNQYLIAESDYDLSLIQTKSCETLTTKIEDQLYEKTEIFFVSMQSALEKFSQLHNEKIGFLEISGGWSSLVLTLFTPQPLVGMQNYNRNKLITFEFKFEAFDIHINTDEHWPNDELVEKGIQLAKKKLIRSLLKKLSNTIIFKEISADKVYMLSNYYYADIDRSAICVEKCILA